MNNVDTIKKLYADFGRGDVAAILANCTRDSRWTIPGQPALSHAGTYVGAQAIQSFFVGLTENLDIAHFEPKRFLSEGDLVVAIGDYSGKGRKSGKPFASRWIHTWNLREGKIAGFDDAYDTLAVANAAGT